MTSNQFDHLLDQPVLIRWTSQCLVD